MTTEIQAVDASTRLVPRFSDLVELWRAAALVWPGHGIKKWVLRGQFYAVGLLNLRRIVPFLRPGPTGLGRLVAARPDTVGMLIWPYVSLSWNQRTRLEILRTHFEVVARCAPRLDVGPNEALLLSDLGDLEAGLRLVVDSAPWFVREGQIVMNLFWDETRLFSLAFTLGQQDTELVAYVGAIQGRKLEGVLETYKDLTGVLQGMRPRDFTIEAFCLLCRVLGVARIQAVSDASRQHRSRYFGAESKNFKQDYDEIWRERGGQPISADFFSLPVGGQRRDFAEIPSKKRSMYRRRYALLDRIEADFREVLRR